MRERVPALVPSPPLRTAQELLRPAIEIGLARDLLHERRRGEVGELPGRRPLAERPQRLVDGLGRGHDGLMAVEADADAVPGEIIEVGELGGDAAEDERDLDDAGHPLELIPLSYPAPQHPIPAAP